MKLVETSAPPRDLDAELAAIDALARIPSLTVMLTPAIILFAFALGWFLAAASVGVAP